MGAILKSVPKRLQAAFLPVIGATALFRLDDLFSDRLTGMLNIEADSLRGKGVRALSFIAAGVVIDGVMGNRKRVNWSWGELVTNIGLIKIASEIFEDEIEPALLGERAEPSLESLISGPGPDAAIDPTGGTVQQGSPAAAVEGFRGMNGMGRASMGRRRMGALVETAPPVFG